MKESTNKYDKALSYHVNEMATFHKYRNPFVMEGLIIASDGYTMMAVSIDKTNPEKYEYNPVIRNATNVLPKEANTHQVFTKSEIERKIKELNEKYNEIYKDHIGPCPDCEGRGTVTYTFEDHEWHDHELEGECPTCVFQNEFIYVTKLETGLEVAQPYKCIVIGDTYFKLDKFERIVNTMNTLGADSITLRHAQGNRNAYVFEIADSTVLLMPLFDNDMEHVSVTLNPEAS